MPERPRSRLSIREMRAFIEGLPKPEGVLGYNWSRLGKVLNKPEYQIFSEIPMGSDAFAQWEHDYPERSEELNLVFYKFLRELEIKPR